MATKNIEPNLRFIGEYTKLAKNDKFVIPEYQRGYSWTTEQCDKLWQDIEDFMGNDPEDPYFFGTIIIDCSSGNELNLIDGQQRTTTFLLLLKALHLRIDETLENMEENDDTRTLRKSIEQRYDKIFEILYKADIEKQAEIEKNWETVRDIKILENRSINELKVNKNDFQEIMAAKTFEDAENAVHKIPYKQKDNKYTNFFKNFKSFYKKLHGYEQDKLNKFAKTFLEKCQIIEIKSWQIEQAITMFNSLNSTGMPLSDVDIISAQLYSHAKDKEEFIESWENIKYMADELCQSDIVDMDAILQQFMYINRAAKKQYKAGKVTMPGVRRYYTTECSKILSDPMDLCKNYKKIIDIWNKIIDYPVIKLLLKFNENSKLFLISYLYKFELKEINKTRITQIAECLLRLFAIMEAGDAGYSSSAFKTFLFNENLKFVDPKYPIDKIRNDFNTHIRTSWEKEEIESDLLDYDKNVLVYLNEYLYAKANRLKFDFSENVNVEHVMPASGWYIESIRTDAGFTKTEDFKRYVNSLGNKILLEGDINKSIGNDWFKIKKGSKISERKGYVGSEFGLAQELSNYPKNKWKKGDIETYTEAAVERILKFIFNE